MVVGGSFTGLMNCDNACWMCNWCQNLMQSFWIARFSHPLLVFCAPIWPRIRPAPKTLIPSQLPTPPKLMSFQATQPNYKAYCDPSYLQNPFAFTGAASIPKGNPCFHTFNALPAQLSPAPKKPLLKGITEEVPC